MSLIIPCKCSHNCGNTAKLSIDEDTEIIMLHVGHVGDVQGAVLNRQDLVNLHTYIGNALAQPLSPALKKAYGMNHVQLKLPGVE